jgi:hypothetical protein
MLSAPGLHLSLPEADARLLADYLAGPCLYRHYFCFIKGRVHGGGALLLSMPRRHMGTTAVNCLLAQRERVASIFWVLLRFVCGSAPNSENHHRRPCQLLARHPGQSMEIRLAFWAAHLQEEDRTRSPITKTCLGARASYGLCRACLPLVYMYAPYTRGLNRTHSSGAPKFTAPHQRQPNPA